MTFDTAATCIRPSLHACGQCSCVAANAQWHAAYVTVFDAMAAAAQHDAMHAYVHDVHVHGAHQPHGNMGYANAQWHEYAQSGMPVYVCGVCGSVTVMFPLLTYHSPAHTDASHTARMHPTTMLTTRIPVCGSVCVWDDETSTGEDRHMHMHMHTTYVPHTHAHHATCTSRYHIVCTRV